MLFHWRSRTLASCDQRQNAILAYIIWCRVWRVPEVLQHDRRTSWASPRDTSRRRLSPELCTGVLRVNVGVPIPERQDAFIVLQFGVRAFIFVYSAYCTVGHSLRSRQTDGHRTQACDASSFLVVTHPNNDRDRCRLTSVNEPLCYCLGRQIYVAAGDNDRMKFCKWNEIWEAYKWSITDGVASRYSAVCASVCRWRYTHSLIVLKH